MGRYYEVIAGPLSYTSLRQDGSDNPAALNVELDMSITEHDTPSGSAWVRVWGMGIGDISQARYLLGQPFQMKAGMTKGLPLVHPEQAGIICSGLISQAYGNWEGVNQTLDLQITAGGTPNPNPGPNPQPVPLNLVFHAKKGDDVAQVMRQTLQTAYPGAAIDGTTKSYPASEEMLAVYNSLEEFALDMRRLTQRIMNDPAAIGVGIRMFNKTHTLGDNTAPEPGGTIHYEDLIGQPTWIGANTLQTKLVMRADLLVMQTMTLPYIVVGNTAAGSGLIGGLPTSLTFQGASTIQKIRHVGNFRQADAASWVTVVDSFVTG